MIGVAVLGATGSIGRATLEVLKLHPERFKVIALTAHRDIDRLEAQCLEFEPELAVLSDPSAALMLNRKIATKLPNTKVLGGKAALVTAAELPNVDYVMAAIVGAAGLLPALAAVKAGKRLLLANKEALVIAGKLFMDAVTQHGAQILPIDSEHNAIFQCLPNTSLEQGLTASGVSKIILTASGGPFLETPLDELPMVTPKQACAHPTWQMGRKISVDSATMMNKGLELIEACWLFNTTPKHIEVVLHPQSFIHSLVQYTDGSVLAQLGHPDMRTPIAHALGWPERIASGVPELDLSTIAPLAFHTPDTERFPCLWLAAEAIATGGTAPAILNAANEIAVAAFLDHSIGFTEIANIVKNVLNIIPSEPVTSLDMLLETDARARAAAEQQVYADKRN